jgi:leucyl aminopeptidase (aminopeptidase T)
VTDLNRAIETVLVSCLGVQSGEDVVIVTDPAKRAIAEMLLEGARALGAEAVVAELAERETHGSEPPRSVAAAMLECDVVIAPTSKSLSHTDARRAATANGVRIATMPNITEDMLGRTMAADYTAIARRSRALAEALTDGDEVLVSTALGTELRLSVAGRAGIADDGNLTTAGAFGNLPAGEGFVAPVEGSASGRIVFDGTIWPIGRLTDPLAVDISDGYISDMTGPSADEFRSLLERHGRQAFAVGELGIGTNDRACLTGNVLEDEKILGTAHVAFGDNHTFGGAIRVSSHQDGIMLDASVAIDGREVLAQGELVV